MRHPRRPPFFHILSLRPQRVPFLQHRCVYLVLRTNNETRIKAAAVFAERLFEGESFVVHEKEPGAELRIPLQPRKDIAALLSVKVLAGGRTTPAYHVFELKFHLPKFAMYVAANLCPFAPTCPAVLRI